MFLFKENCVLFFLCVFGFHVYMASSVGVRHSEYFNNSIVNMNHINRNYSLSEHSILQSQLKNLTEGKPISLTELKNLITDEIESMINNMTSENINNLIVYRSYVIGNNTFISMPNPSVSSTVTLTAEDTATSTYNPIATVTLTPTIVSTTIKLSISVTTTFIEDKNSIITDVNTTVIQAGSTTSSFQKFKKGLDASAKPNNFSTSDIGASGMQASSPTTSVGENSTSFVQIHVIIEIVGNGLSFWNRISQSGKYSLYILCGMVICLICVAASSVCPAA